MINNDTISRQAALEAVKKNTFRLTFAEEQGCEGHVAWSAEAIYSDVIEGALLELPSVSTEKTGRWEKIKSGDKAFPESIVCSRCGNENSYINEWNFNNEPLSKVFKTSKYCPNCGCHMVEPQESEE